MRTLLIAVVIALACGTATADRVCTTILQGETATAFAQGLGAGWQVGGGACAVVFNRLTVTQLPTEDCAEHRVDYVFSIEGDVALTDYCACITPTCDLFADALGSVVEVDRGACNANNTEQCSPASSCSFSFPFEGPDQTVFVDVTERGPIRIPALGRWGGIAAFVGLACIGIIVLVRRAGPAS